MPSFRAAALKGPERALGGAEPAIITAMSSAAAREGTPVDALIIGAGPSGLFTAVELARRGVGLRIVDAEPTAHRQSRATTIMPSSLAHFTRAGLADRFLQAAIRINRFTVRDNDLAEVATMDFAGLNTPVPFALTLPQWMTEQLLADRLSELGVEVERGVTATELDMRVDGTGVVLKGPLSSELINARAVVGAGGAHGVVRAAMRQVLQGGTYDRRFAVADVVVETGLRRDEVTRVIGERGIVLLGPLPGGRTLIIMDLPAGDVERLAREPALDQMQRLLQERLTAPPRMSDLRWSSCFTLHHRIAKSFGDIRRYLVGDAAHVESLFSGMGMNAGLHDAANLGWKLAYCLNQRAHAGLLHTYVLERRPADERSMAISDAGHRKIIDPPPAEIYDSSGGGPVSVEPRPSVDPRLTVLMLDERYHQSPLVGSRYGAGVCLPAGLVPGSLFPDFTEPTGAGHTLYLGSGATAPNGFTARWDEILELADTTPACVPSDCLVLVRPDGFIGFVASPVDAAAFAQLEGMLSSWFTLPGWFQSAEAAR